MNRRTGIAVIVLSLPAFIAVSSGVSCKPSAPVTSGNGGNTSSPSATNTGAGASGSTGATLSGTTSGQGVTTSTGGADPCPLCVTPSDCAGGSCAQLGADSYCRPNCSNGSCPAGQTCVTTSDVGGNQVSVCVMPNSICSTPASGPSATSSSTTTATTSTGSGTNTCGPYVGPNATAQCHSCSGSNCQPNGCYGGWWCDTATDKCHAPPTNCGSSSTTTTSTTGATTAVTTGPGVTTGTGGGPIGPNGGTVSTLYFSIVGDTRPPVIGDTSGYPTAIITKIYQDIQGLNPSPPFSVSTGDYMFATTSSTTQASQQLDIYLSARNQFSGQFFPAMGNHECTGAVTSNCGPNGTNGMTPNYQAFLTKLLGPINQSNPYYSINVNGPNNAWTSKFVFIAANAWDSNQASWLQQTLAQPTTYTFIMRHEPAAASSPGTSASEQIMAQYPYTMAICGHTHLYNHLTQRQIVVGNGGAPITGGQNYGFATATQRSDGAIQFEMYDYMTLQTDPSWAFAVNADGSPAP